MKEFTLMPGASEPLELLPPNAACRRVMHMCTGKAIAPSQHLPCHLPECRVHGPGQGSMEPAAGASASGLAQALAADDLMVVDPETAAAAAPVPSKPSAEDPEVPVAKRARLAIPRLQHLVSADLGKQARYFM